MHLFANEQKPEKRVTDKLLSVHSIFYTIQGEGPFCGRPATFIRLAGCNIQCVMCDTDYTVGRQMLSIEDITKSLADNHSHGLVVITGGEPFRQDITALCYRLIAEGYLVQIETNGTLPPPEGLQQIVSTKLSEPLFGVYIVCSPKTGKVNEQTARLACCFKYVLSSESVDRIDGLPVLALEGQAGALTEQRVARPPDKWFGQIYLQPMDENCKCDDCVALNKAHLDACVKSCLDHGYTLQLQVHKLIGLP